MIRCQRMRNKKMQDKQTDFKNITLAIFISTMFIIIWQVYFEPDPLPVDENGQVQQTQKINDAIIAPPDFKQLNNFEIDPKTRININSDTLEGSLAQIGGRIDDLTLSKYNKELGGEDKVELLVPSGKEGSYFLDFGWLSNEAKTPIRATRWQTSQKDLKPGDSVRLSWRNSQNITFARTYSLDQHYMFTIIQEVFNDSSKAVALRPYGLINRELPQDLLGNFILHEGPLGYLQDELQEFGYSDLDEEGKIEIKNTNGWFGITDKYWLTSIIPTSKSFDVNISAFKKNTIKRYQVDYLGEQKTLLPGKSMRNEFKFFAGPKEVELLDEYGEKFGMQLFDRAVDFGILYFLTKPIFEALHFLNGAVGNFGVAIIILTLIIKLILYPLAKKSYVSLNKMRELHPEMVRIRELYMEDRMRMNQELMSLYKRENVNPAAGCLPILLQLPIFFALYKVLFVTIEMRHAPFFGWVQDLSAKDPTNLFTLFGMLDWGPPEFMHIGIWPLIMTVTMIIQTKLNPKPADPAQEMVMKIIPLVFMFLFATFPAGLVIYWAFSNLLTIIQQWMIKRKYIN